MNKDIDFSQSFDEDFTVGQILTIRAMLTIIETGRLSHKAYSMIAILPDGAGISFGKNQTTENSGGLYRLLAMYQEMCEKEGQDFAFSDYMERLYDGKDSSKKGALTSDKSFHQELVSEADDVRLFREAQRRYFHKHYFRPAYEIASEYAITNPLILAQIYDIAIQSGITGAKRLISKFDKTWKSPAKFDIDNDGHIDYDKISDSEYDELERLWGQGLTDYRLEWLLNFKSSRNPAHSNIVRKSSYRSYAFKDQIEKENWGLELPFDFRLISKYKRRVPKITSFTLTEDIVRQVELH